MAVFVVISHIKLMLSWGINGSTGLSLDPNFLLSSGSGRSGCGRGVRVRSLSGGLSRVRRRLLPAGCRASKRSSALTEVSFGYVDVALENSGWAVSGRVLAVVRVILDVNLGVGVTLIRLAVTKGGLTRQ